MKEKINIIHRLKFELWYLSKIHSFFNKPIQFVGKLSTINLINAYKKRLKKNIFNLLPNDRYERTLDISKQFYLLKSKTNSNIEIKSMEILLNHFRLPYSIVNIEDLNNQIFFEKQESIVFLCTKINIDKVKIFIGKKNCKIIVFVSDENKIKNHNKNVAYINESPVKLLPFYHGLRSKIVKEFTDILLSLNFLIVSGFMPPQISLRIDDVLGKNFNQYISTILNFNWKPNLGIFIDEFNKNNDSDLTEISSLNKKDIIEISPHAFNKKKFIFFDYPNGIAISKEKFNLYWNIVEKKFNEWDFKISPVVNAHFHAYSDTNFDIFMNKGIKYIFSELPANKIKLVPNKKYIPSGDPLNTTGQITDNNIIQIYSGDSVLDCNQKKSNYDFLMHAGKFNISSNAFERIKKRLSLSLSTGFATFITTHEYLINKLKLENLSEIFLMIDDFIKSNKLKPKKVSLSEIGRACENHTNIIIQSVKNNKNDLEINLNGKSNGDFYLTIFGNNKMELVKFPSFNENVNVKIKK